MLVGRARETLTRVGSRALALEPFYVIPAAVALLAYPNPLVTPALLLVALPWALRWALTGRPTATTPFDVPVGLFMAGAIVGLFATTSERWAGIRICGILAGVALFYLIVNHATTERRLRVALLTTTLCALLGSIALVVITAPYLAIGSIPGPWDGLIQATDGWRQAVLGPSEALERFRFRASGVGGLATFGLALAVGPSLAGARPSTRMTGYLLSAFFAAIVLLSGNRASLVSVAALGVVLLGLRNGWFLAAVPVVLVGFWLAVERGVFGLSAPDAEPLAVKLTFWRNAALMLHDYALTGAGLGLRSVRDLYEAYFLPVGPRFSHAHNAFIQAYLEQGLLGCAGLVSVAAMLVFYGRRAVATARGPVAWGTALSAGGAATVLFFEGLTEVVLLTSVGTVLLLVALGLLVAAARQGERRTPSDDASRWPIGSWRRPRVATPVLACFVVAFVAALVLTPLGASAALNVGAVERARAMLPDGISRDERERRLTDADATLRRGIAIDDRDPALWRNLAEIAIARGDGEEARTLLRRARERTMPGDAYGLFQLGRLQKEAGFWRDAVRSWQEAGADAALKDWASDLRARRQWDRASAALLALAELRPTDADAHRQYGQAQLLLGTDPEETLRELGRLSELAPSSPWPHVELARLYDALNRPAEAAAARRAVAARGAT